jgi:hypothetical protein
MENNDKHVSQLNTAWRIRSHLSEEFCILAKPGSPFKSTSKSTEYGNLLYYRIGQHCIWIVPIGLPNISIFWPPTFPLTVNGDIFANSGQIPNYVKTSTFNTFSIKFLQQIGMDSKIKQICQLVKQ